MDLAPPTSDSVPTFEQQPDDPHPLGRPQHVIGGVAALLASRLGIDALWIRIAFVLMALVGGIGVLVYGAMWLALVAGAAPQRRWARVVGGVSLVVGLPLLLTSGFPIFDGPVAVLALLAGLAVALWQPRSAPAPAPAAPAAPAQVSEPAPLVTGALYRTRRPPSILGRLTLGISVLVSAAGALIDQANGGRLHPEQWLGAGAIVCGVGLVAGAFAGRARWLVVPAVVLAATGFVAGEAARAGVRPTALIGDEFVHVDRSQPGGTRGEHVAIGTIDVVIDGAPRSPATVEARVAIGDIDVRAASDVTVEIRADVDHGTVDVDGVRRGNGTFTVGPAGTPDVVVTAIIGRGDLDVEQFEPDEQPPTPPAPAEPGSPMFVADGVTRSLTGDLVLADGDAVVGANGDVLTGDFTTRGRVTIITTTIGEFQLLPGGLLVTPYGELLELQAPPGG